MILIKKTTLIVMAAMGFTLCALGGPVAGSNDGSRRIDLTESTVMLGATVPPGSYTLSWHRERGSEEVRIEIARGRKVLATGTGRWIESPQASPYESLVYSPDARGTNQLTEIRFKGSADSIRIEVDTAPANAQAEAVK